MRFILAIALLVLSGVALADEHGPFFCGPCTLGEPTPDGESQMFIGQVANQYDDGDYEIGDGVTICNGIKCVTYVRAAFSWVIRPGSRRDDPGGPYQNQPNDPGVVIGDPGYDQSCSWSTRTVYAPRYETWQICSAGRCYIEYVNTGFDVQYETEYRCA